MGNVNCNFDPIGKDRFVYTFKNRCEEDSSLYLDDKTTKVFLNPYGKVGEVSDDLRAFLQYLATKTVSTAFVKQLDKAVQNVRQHDDWRIEYMTLYAKYEEMREEGYKDGYAEGIEQGIEKQKKETLNMLVKLVKNGLLDVQVASMQVGMSKEEFEKLF